MTEAEDSTATLEGISEHLGPGSDTFRGEISGVRVGFTQKVYSSYSRRTARRDTGPFLVLSPH